MTTYPAITVWQPWASLIAAGLKPYEFRGHAAPQSFWGRRIAIHAGARPIKKDEVKALLLKLRSKRWQETGLSHDGAMALLERVKDNPWSFPLSSVLCTALLGEPIRNEALAEQLGLPPVNDSDRTEESAYGWPLTDIETLQPFVPARGAQGFWYWNAP